MSDRPRVDAHPFGGVIAKVTGGLGGIAATAILSFAAWAILIIDGAPAGDTGACWFFAVWVLAVPLFTFAFCVHAGSAYLAVFGLKQLIWP